MIQRIQSVYLFAAAALAVCLFCFPYVEITSNGFLFKVTACHLSPAVEGLSAMTMVPLALVISLFVVLCLFTLFKYNNRTLQMKLTRICNYLQIVILATMIAYIVGLSKTPGSDKLVIDVSLLFPMIIPVVNIILLVLARRGIKKDDDLVKSADRLR